MEDWLRIIKFLRLNFPGGCQAIVICKDCLFGQDAGEAERQKTYQELDKLERQGLLIKKWEGFYQAKQVSNNRRYYLHRCVKRFFPVNSREKTVYYTEGTLTPESIMLKLKELMSIGYNIQITIK